MKVVQINATCGVGSTGNICVDISRILNENNIENYILYSSRSNGYECGIQCSSNRVIKYNALKSRFLGNYGFNSSNATKKMINEIERIKPDIVHLHNIHGHDCNIEILFNYFKSNKTKLIWTFHDCWAFTGYCTYFTMVNCDKWKSRCDNCIQYREYSFFSDKSYDLFERKRELFKDLDLTVITPSQWLANLVSQSFFKGYPVNVIYNGIDLNIYKPIKSDFKAKYYLKEKKIVLGVALGWETRKGLDVFIELSERLSSDYKVVLIGTNETIDKKLPDNILSIHRTHNQQELAEIYSIADVFVNPTREEVLGLTNIEANACGTPVLTFNTGGSPECINSLSGKVVACDDIDSLEKEIIRVCEDKPYSEEQCVKKAKEFDKNERFKEYIELYKKLFNESL